MKTRNSGSAAHIVILCLCWYLISSLGSQVTKSILTIYPKPLFLGEFQFIYTVFLAAICCFIAHRCRTFYRWFPRGTFPLYYEDETREKRQIKTLTRPTKHILLTVLPLSFFQFVGKYFGHTATSLVPVSTVASIKTLSPVFILIFQRLLNVQRTNMSGLIYFSLACLIMGVWIIVGEDNAQRTNDSKKSQINPIGLSTYGVLCAVSSMLIFVAQNIYGKNVFTLRPEGLSEKPDLARDGSPLPIFVEKKTNMSCPKSYDKLTLLIYIPLVGFCLSFLWFVNLELPSIWTDVKENGMAIIPWKLLLLNGTFHFMQAMITFHLMGEISTLTYSIANLMKRIAIITVSWAFSGANINLKQVIGLILNMIGLFLYERHNSKNKPAKLH